jgi:ATP-binding cassette, subfamily B, heavy metal transporter
METFINFYRYILKYKWHFIVYLLAAAISQISINLIPYFLKWITSALLALNYPLATNLAIGLGVALLANTLFYAFAMVLSDRGILKSVIDLQLDVMRKIHDLDFTYHTEKSSGKLISIMKRGEDSFFNMYDILNRDVYFLIVALGFMLFAFAGINLKYVLVSVITMAISSVVTIFLIKINLNTRKRFTHIEDAVSGARVDNLINFDTVKYFAKESFEQNRLSGLLKEWYDAGQKYFNTFRYFDLTIGNFTNVAITVTVLMAILDFKSGLIDLPKFILISSFSASFYPRLGSIVMSLRNVARKYGDLELYFGILKENVSVEDTRTPESLAQIAGQISFDKVGFAYHSKNSVFSDFSLNIASGESVALVGLSGSGKTTLVKLLMRMYDLNSGTIAIDGLDIRRMSKSYLRSLIGIVPQDPLMFNHTIRYNVGYADSAVTDLEIWQALKSAHLDEFVRSLPNGLETQVGERGIKLSGGQRQRLAIARVLLKKPKIIVMDEATSSLDSESEGAIQEAFWDMVKDPQNPKTSIIIAHRLSTVMRTNRIIVLQNGTIAEAGTHHSLLNREKGVYKHLWSLQQNGFLQ